MNVKKPQDRLTEQMWFRVTKKERANLERAAKRMKIKASEWLRDVVREALK